METCSGQSRLLGINSSQSLGPRVVLDGENCHVSLETSFHGNALAVLKLIFPSKTKTLQL